MEINGKKVFGGVIAFLSAVVLIAQLAMPAPALAQTPSPVTGPPAPQPTPQQIQIITEKLDCSWYNLFCWAQKIFGAVIEWIMSIFLFIVGIFITLAVSLIQTLIQLSRDIAGSPMVRSGFGVTLGIANLGFVLVIILLAFTTILRIERYQLKQTLYRLIVAAILVNFSLAIAGVVMDFTNALGYFFIEKVSGGSSPAELWKFGSEMAAALKIQNLTNIKDALDIPVGDVVGSAFDFGLGLFTSVLSLFSALIFSILIMLVFLGIGIMLLIRYVYIIILLILMPLAWLFWILPDMSSYARKWWDTFLKWNFFLPAVTFFLYLAMLSSRNMDSIVAQIQNSSSYPSSVAAEKYLIQKDGVISFLSLFIKLGLFASALLVGQKLGIAGSGIAMAGVDGVKKWATGATLRQTVGRLGRKEEGGKSMAEKLQDRIAKGGRLTKFLGAPLVQGVNRLAEIGGADQVKQAEAQIAKTSVANQKARLLNPLISNPMMVAILKNLTEKNELKDLDMSQYINEKTKKTFISNNQGKTFGNMEKTAGVNIEMIQAIQSGAPDALERGEKAAAQFLQSFSKEDIKKVQIDDLYSTKKAFGLEGDQKKLFQAAFSHGVAAANPGFLAGIIPKIKGANLENFDQVMKQAIGDLPDGLAKENAKKSFEKNMARRMFGSEEPETPQGAAGGGTAGGTNP
ncbi:MAG TPA: hypothetical protein VJB92_01635 [Candidatus Paceibacterota bacterium]